MAIFWRGVNYKKQWVDLSEDESELMTIKTVTYWFLIVPIYSRTTAIKNQFNEV